MSRNTRGAIIRPYRGVMPRIHETAFVAEGAVVIGDVEIGPHASVWYGCVLRGDVNRIAVGEGTNLQDGTIVHCDSDKEGLDYRETGGGHPTLIGKHITIGHMALGTSMAAFVRWVAHPEEDLEAHLERGYRMLSQVLLPE